MSFSPNTIKWIITCEHAGNKIPHDYLPYFKGAEGVLRTHRGMDIGVKEVFNQFIKKADFYLINHQSRLLIEFNRSLHHKDLFSEFSKSLHMDEKEHLIHHYYLPYRRRLEKKISEFISGKNDVIHLSIHSFTPVLNDEVRNADIGLLYDSRKIEERHFCVEWKRNIDAHQAKYKTRLNYPYLGKADGLTTYLRKVFPSHYIGVEVELNQKLATNFTEMARVLVDCLPK